jgi:hypothetical protein
MSTQKAGLSVLLAAVRALRSDDPAIRRPAISMLLELARQDHGTIRTTAERVLTDEFGPYAVSDGLPGCSAPIEAVEVCDGNCRSCVWLWLDRPSASAQQNSTLSAEPASQSATLIDYPPCKAVA